MKTAIYYLTGLALILCFACPLQAKDADAYIEEAKKLNEGGKLGDAIALLQQAAAEHPDNSDIHAYLGLYLGSSAGQTGGDYMEAMRLVNESFATLDKALELDPGNIRGYLFRGIMGVQIPKMLGKLDIGIGDLERVIAVREKDPKSVESETLVAAYRNLAIGYEKEESWEKVRMSLEKLVELAPETDTAAQAKEKLKTLPAPRKEKPTPLIPREGDSAAVMEIKKKLDADPENTALLMQLAMMHYEAGDFAEAVEVLKLYVEIDKTNADAYKLLGIAVARMGEKGYDHKIYEDTDYRSMLVFESMGYLDRALKLAPDDTETRLIRGIFGVAFPFFTGRHDQGVADLELVAQSEVSDSMKAEALFYLGFAKQREATRYWIDVAKKYPDHGAAAMVFDAMRPSVRHFDPSKYEKPFVAIDFVLGFQDELPPQTAVWIEDKEGTYVNTIYVSGFSGYAKEKQINLPVWSAMSEFKNVEAVTGASIDVGHHIYTWDLTGINGKRVDRGTYKVRVEVTYWPTMLYQNVEAVIRVGKKQDRAVVEEGNYIPYLEATYYPK